MSTKIQGKRRQRTVVVMSAKMDKTRVVRAERMTQHPLFKKRIKKFINFKIHDERNESKVGDVVRVMETRPISKDKRWCLVEIVESKKE